MPHLPYFNAIPHYLLQFFSVMSGYSYGIENQRVAAEEVSSLVSELTKVAVFPTEDGSWVTGTEPLLINNLPDIATLFHHKPAVAVPTEGLLKEGSECSAVPVDSASVTVHAHEPRGIMFLHQGVAQRHQQNPHDSPWTALRMMGIVPLSECLLPPTDHEGSVDFDAYWPNVIMLALSYAPVGLLICVTCSTSIASGCFLPIF